MERLKVDDTVYVIVPADCKSGECSDVDGPDCEYSAFRTPGEAVVRCRERHARVSELNLFRVEYVFEKKGNYIRLNSWLEVDENEVFATPEAALNALKGEAINV